MASFVEQMGNIEFLMMAIGSVVFFTLLLVTGNTMAISVRERTGELAVLKTVGFSDRCVLVLVLAESLLLAVLGGGARHRRWPRSSPCGGDPTNGMLASFYLPPVGHRGRRRARPRGRPAGRPAARRRRHAPAGRGSAAAALSGPPPRLQPRERARALDAPPSWPCSASRAASACSWPCWPWPAASRPRWCPRARRRTR